MSFLTDLHAQLRRARVTREGATHLPKDVPTGTHKTYPRMEKIPLPHVPLSRSFSETLEARKSADGFSHAPLSARDLGTVLSSLRRHPDSTRRLYPSGGGLYPIETYLIAETFDSYTRTVFHYDPTAHALEVLWSLPHAFVFKDLVKRPHELTFPALIIFTALWERSSAKYGNLSYQHALLEAGHMSENVLLAASASSLAARPMAGFDDTLVASALDIDVTVEQAVHAVLLGHKPARTSKRAVA